ncbi:TadE family type IV pilus minor pilin [Frankia sp. Cas3]|uniref:TadE family type IV pilus minor pilin n=1 Tax=Frankia sp. Cas3 TaxID=3073926 RepID=UPI002AD4FD71|nr:TadE family type IV pilus minor pilin [Frankia sp. Cas3]
MIRKPTPPVMPMSRIRHYNDLPSTPGDHGVAGVSCPAVAVAQRHTARDGGQATAELAVAIPSLILVLLIAIWVLSAVSVQAQCAEAARVGARAAARGETDEVVRSWSRRAAPRGAEISVTHGGNFVVVQVRLGVRATGGLAGIMPAINITMSSTAPLESAETI